MFDGALLCVASNWYCHLKCIIQNFHQRFSLYSDNSVLFCSAYKLWINIPLLGEVASLAGGGREGFKDGFGKEARFNYPEGLYFDTDSNLLYVAEFVSINKETLM